MSSKWILLFVLTFAGTRGFPQLNERTNSHVQWSGLGFIKGTNYHKGAGENCGIYSTESDREARNLSLAIDCKSEDHKIKRGFIRDKSAIRIVREEETLSYFRRDLYGYRDCNGNEYHFFSGRSYEWVNPGEDIRIYRVFEQKGKLRVAKFFFASGSGNLRPLTLQNITDQFSHEPLFLEKLRLLADNNFQLVKYLHVINRVRIDAAQGI